MKRIRDGGSFSTRSCSATQRGRVIFTCMASFQATKEVSDYDYQVKMPSAPDPDSLPDERQRIEASLRDPRIPDSIKPILRKQLDRQGADRTRK